MLQYPSISKQVINTPVYAFDKLDGSNIRAEWTPKGGFVKFGSRSRLLGEDEKPLGEAITIFRETMADALDPALRKLRNERVTLFMEFLGDTSFAGNHKEDEQHRLVLFDASLYKRGFMMPKEFLKAFDSVVETPDLLHYGKPTQDFQDSVHGGELEGMTFEGVICKSQELHRGRQVVFKVKNDAWLERLRAFTKNDAELFKKLA